MRAGRQVRALVRTFEGSRSRERTDWLSGEEPLEVRLATPGGTAKLTVTMRTPGHDFELVAGLLLAEGVIGGPDDLRRLTYCTDPGADTPGRYNVVSVELRPGLEPDLAGLGQTFSASSACGVCGRAGLEALHGRGLAPLPPGPPVAPRTLYGLPDALRAAQATFEATGGLHAAALFSPDGRMLCLREDIGRHNAVDKVLGWALLEHRPVGETVMLVSGRAGYEIVQKAVVARVPVLCSVSAPSSLAVALAVEFGLTLVGFLRGERMNVYAGFERVAAG